MQQEQETDLTSMTADIVAAYVANNAVPASELPSLITTVHAAMAAASSGSVAEPEPEALKPAVPIRKSVTPDAIICLEDGKSFKSLKRHLMTKYGLSPADYRAKWGLPSDYPMVASNYAASRSALAKSMGLGVSRGRQPEPASAPTKRGRPKKAAPAPA